ncbi:hypothetical protein FQR65_LT19768 [Abscondita terminalis]|nr:hypothetical protein FQR65_LT19768 [Abscondita terminalis]
MHGILYKAKRKRARFMARAGGNAAPELADALLAAKSNTAIKQIWVAKGTYKPLYKAAEVDDNNAPTTDRDKAFVLVKDVKLYGGFAGTETDISQRDLNHPTKYQLLSRDLGDQALARATTALPLTRRQCQMYNNNSVNGVGSLQIISVVQIMAVGCIMPVPPPPLRA